MFYYGKGVDRDYVEAISWNRKAGEKGNIDAQLLFTDAYSRGLGVDVDGNVKVYQLWQNKSVPPVSL